MKTLPARGAFIWRALKAAFLSGALQLFQVVFTRERNNKLAASRAHLYS